MGYMFGVLGLSPTADRNQHPRELVFLVDEWPQVVGATGEYVLGEHAPVPVDWAWHHVAVVFELDPPQDGPHRVSLFLDGVLVGRDPAFPRAPPDANAFADTLIGADDVYHPDYVFSGMIADVRISDTARYGLAPDCTDLGDTCIQPLEPCLLPDDDTIAYWPLSEGAGCEVHDLTNGEPGSRPPDTTAFDGYVGEDVEDEDCSDRWTPSVGLPCSER